MEDNQKLGLPFIVYMLAEIVIAIFSMILYNKGILTIKPGVNMLLYALLLQIAIHIGIVTHGWMRGKTELYRNFYTFSVPPIVMVLISWYNTF